MGSAEGLGRERKRVEKRSPGESTLDVLMKGKLQVWPHERRVVRAARFVLKEAEHDEAQRNIRDYFAVRDYLHRRGRVRAKSD